MVDMIWFHFPVYNRH